MIRNRIDFKNVRGTVWGYPTKTLLVNVLKELKRDSSITLAFGEESLQILQGQLDFTKNLEAIQVGFSGLFAHTFHESVCDSENALILEIANFLKTTSFVSHKDQDEF